MSLLEYQEAAPWANGIKMQLLERRMPPWLPEDGIGDFLHTRTLTAREIDIIVDWAVGVTPEGEPLAPESESESDGAWEMGEPDLILLPSNDVVLGEDIDEAVRCVVIPTGLGEASRLAAFEVRPGAATVVRRVTARLGEDCDASVRPSFTWLPGQGVTRLKVPERLPAGSQLALEILYRKGWNEEGFSVSDRTVAALKLGSSAEPVEALLVSSGEHRLQGAVDLVAIFPDPAPTDAEKPFRVEAVRPDGEVMLLLSIEHYEPDWREKYLLRAPVRLPPDTVLRLSRPAAWLDIVRTRSSADR